MNKYTFHIETDFDFLWDKSSELFRLHKEEIDLFGLDLNIDEEVYRQCFASNEFLFFTVRLNLEIVGYAGFFLFNHTHHKGSVHAKQDILFIKREHRGVGLSFIKYCDSMLKDIGVEIVHQCVSARFDWGLILKRIGYEKLETIYTRNLWAEPLKQSKKQ